MSGRVIAPVMGVGGAGWLERPEREAEEEPSRAIEALDLRAGMTVADIGAGSGLLHRPHGAQSGRPEGRVYATDIQVGMLSLLQRRAKQERHPEHRARAGAVDDPKLPPGSLDLALMVDVYHELSPPQAFVRRLREALKPEGRLVLIEFRKEDPRVPIREEHKMSVEQVRAGARRRRLRHRQGDRRPALAAHHRA